MKTYGLLGKNIEYSFSRSYFKEKFTANGIQAVYKNFDLKDLYEFPQLIQNNPKLAGLNVTIPYKEKIIPYLDRLDDDALEIGAVNTIKIEENRSLTGYNTDHIGFTKSLKPLLTGSHTHALILGTGGASRAIAYSLDSLGIKYNFVTRQSNSSHFTYKELDKHLLELHTIIINTTPLGTHPNHSDYPNIPVDLITERHLVYDLIYNPTVTQLMKLAANNGAQVLNGKQMLEIQANKSWEIWTRDK